MELRQLSLSNDDLLIKKAKSATMLERNSAKNAARFAIAFDDLLKNSTLKAIMILCGQEFKFVNKYDSDKIKIEKQYGIKGGKFVQYYVDAKIEQQLAADDFDAPAIATKPIAVDTSQLRERTKSTRVSALVNDLMKVSLDLTPIYDSWINQLIAKGEELMKDDSFPVYEDDDLDSESLDGANESTSEEFDSEEDEILEADI